MNIECTRLYLENDILDVFNKTINALDEPIYSTVAMSTYCLANAASHKIKGVLTGDGSDELLFGYKYQRSAIMSNEKFETYLDGIGWLKYIDKKELVGECKYSDEDILHSLISGCEIMNNENETLRRIELFKRLPDYHLMRIDRMTMASGVEARIPFLRKKYVEYLLSIEDTFILEKEDVKYILKKAFDMDLPAVLLRSSKCPFTAPIKRWIESDLKNEIIRVFNDRKLINRLQLNQSRILKILDEYKGRYEDVSNIWGIFVLLKWCELHECWNK